MYLKINLIIVYLIRLTMNFLTTSCIFIVILFFYIYIMDQFKKSEDLDIYETDFSDNAQLQEICDIRQPVLFHFRSINPHFFQDISPKNIAKFGSYDVKIKDAHDYYKDNRIENSHVDAVALSLHTSMKLLENDNAAHFFSENNDDFLEESGLSRSFQTLDSFLKPTFNIHTKYDLMFGSCGAITPLRYHTNYRQFLSVTSGKIRVKMTPWRSSKYLHGVKDYENYEFRSAVHPLNPQPQYSIDFDKTKFLEFDVLAGYVLYVPPYWWYSIQYLDDPSTFVCGISYTTVMNSISNIWDLTIHWLQQQNITKKITKIDTSVKRPVETDKLSIHSQPQNVSEPKKEIVEKVVEEIVEDTTHKLSDNMENIPETISNDFVLDDNNTNVNTNVSEQPILHNEDTSILQENTSVSSSL